ncbi:MAG: hypothetical protein LBV26_07385 [Bacteroidales bacterium]|jgi:hypothetical protein|nr:hypothetical protein [Bacteroidales bacterium]
MAVLSNYESRQGSLKCGVNRAYAFITDFRNFGRFANSNSIADWQADRESCSFNVAMLGKVGVRLAEKEETGKVVYRGNASGNIDFTVTVGLSGNDTEPSKISINLSAYLNPVMKMMADKPVRMFLDLLISEIESFDGWEDIEG